MQDVRCDVMQTLPNPASSDWAAINAVFHRLNDLPLEEKPARATVDAYAAPIDPASENLTPPARTLSAAYSV